MMTAPPKPTGTDEICPICSRPRKEHTPEEALKCSRKMMETGEDEKD